MTKVILNGRVVTTTSNSGSVKGFFPTRDMALEFFFSQTERFEKTLHPETGIEE